MKILLTSASSYVGARIFYDLKRKFSLIGTYFQNRLSPGFIKLDITNREEIKKMFLKMKPDIIIHVANYPSVKNSVGNEKNYIALNRNATRYIIDVANEIGAKVVFISSLAAVNPTDIYGKLKLESEELIKTVKMGYLVLRCSLIVGFSPNTKSDRLFNRILKCLDDEAKPAIFDMSWELQPTYIGHISQIIAQTVQNSLWNKTLPVFINEVVTQYQIAKDILNYFKIIVESEDKHINIPLAKDNQKELKTYSLVPNFYKDMITTIIEEMQSRKKIVI